MAPMLGRKVFQLVNELTEPAKAGEEIYTIEHSKESFRDKKQCEARLQLYERQIWTCKSTGNNKLTHKEAWDQEQKISKFLQQKFQPWFEKPVLEIVHYSTLALEQLVDKVYGEIMIRYVVEEQCNYEDENAKCMRVKIIKVYTFEKANQESPEKRLECACNTSSSANIKTNEMVLDNMEAFKEEELGLVKRQKESLRVQVPHSPLEHSKLKKENKWAPKYDVKLKNGDIIATVPAKSLHRLKRPPGKDIVRYFIRHYALRIGMGRNAHWAAEDELVRKHSLPSKFRNLLQDSNKSIVQNSPPGTSTKKRKMPVSPEKKPPLTIKVKKEEKKNAEVQQVRKASQTTDLSSPPWHDKQVSEELPSTELKTNNQEHSNCPMDELQDITSTNVPCKSNSVQIPNTCIVPVALTRKKDWEDFKAKKTTTLETSNGSPKVFWPSTSTAVPFQTSRKIPIDTSSMVFYLTAFYRDKDCNDQKFYLSTVITKAARLLTNDHLALLPKDPRIWVKKRYKKLEHKQLLVSMTENQRTEEMTEQNSKLKRKIRENTPLREKEINVDVEKQGRYDYQDISVKRLPKFKRVHTPQEMPNMFFGDVVKVVECLNSLSTLLVPDGQYPVNAVMLMEALTVGSRGFLYLNRLLMTLLYILLKSKIGNDFTELGIKVSEIPLTIYSVSELVRLCLLHSNAKDYSKASSQLHNAEDSEGSPSFDNTAMDHCFFKKLKTTEYFELTIREKLNVMGILCHCILSTHDVDMEDEGMIRPVSRQRFLLMQAYAEKEEKDRPLEEKLDKAEEMPVQKQKTKMERKLAQCIAKAKLALNKPPIGTDRNHNRYWMFSENVPGLFIEKSWIHDRMNYTCSQSPKKLNREECGQDAKDIMQKGDTSKNVTTAASSVGTKPMVPNLVNNIWFFCDTQEELDELLNCLHPQGVRERKLKECLHRRYQDIMHSIQLVHKPNPVLKHCDGQKELQNRLRSDVTDVATQLRNAGLGDLNKTARFEAGVTSLHNLKEFGGCLIALQASISERFLQGLMAPNQKSLPEVPIIKTKNINGNRMTEKTNVSSDVERWRSAIRNAKTFSRMHVLLGMLKVCIKWPTSSENVQCKVCSEDLKTGKDFEGDEHKDEFDYYINLLKQQLSSRKAAKAQNISSSNDYQPPMKKSKMVVNKGSQLFNPPVSSSYVNETADHNMGAQCQNPELQKCQYILNKLFEYKFSWPFREPLIFEQTDDYMAMRINHIDFVVMLSKCMCNIYNSVHEFFEDIKMVFFNVAIYSYNRKHLNICLENTEKYLVALLRKHLPGYTYQRTKLGRRPAKRLAPQEEPAADHYMRKKKKN